MVSRTLVISKGSDLRCRSSLGLGLVDVYPNIDSTQKIGPVSLRTSSDLLLVSGVSFLSTCPSKDRVVPGRRHSSLVMGVVVNYKILHVSNTVVKVKFGD